MGTASAGSSVSASPTGGYCAAAGASSIAQARASARTSAGLFMRALALELRADLLPEVLQRGPKQVARVIKRRACCFDRRAVAVFRLHANSFRARSARVCWRGARAPVRLLAHIGAWLCWLPHRARVAETLHWRLGLPARLL